MILSQRQALKQMKLQGIFPDHQVPDNEISAAYKAEILSTDMTYQLVPPNYHHRNIANKAIQNWKDHFVGVLSVTAATFTVHLWCQAIPLAKQQLFLLRKSNANKKIFLGPRLRPPQLRCRSFRSHWHGITGTLQSPPT